MIATANLSHRLPSSPAWKIRRLIDEAATRIRARGFQDAVGGQSPKSTDVDYMNGFYDGTQHRLVQDELTYRQGYMDGYLGRPVARSDARYSQGWLDGDADRQEWMQADV